MMPNLEIAALLEPVPGDAPCGESLLHDPEYDAVRAARREDDPSLPTGVWQTELKVPDWDEVEARCRRLLTERSKDLTIAAWLGESWLHRYGWTALPHCFELALGLCERYWEDLHPLPRDGDWGYRAAPLSWLVGAYADVLSVRCELFEGRSGLRVTLAQWQAAQREALLVAARKDVPAAKREAATSGMAALHDAVRGGSAELMRMRQSALAAARPLIGKLDAWCTPRLGAESPSFGVLIKTMDDADHVLTECLAMHPNSTPAGEQYATAGEPEQAAAPTATPGVPQSREDAYRQLASIAQYLLRYEPHSPVPYMIQRALEWGSKPLPELIQELMASDAGGPKLWSMLGLLPGDEGKGK
jgi:type VI secretion system protein ImpA